MKAQSQFGENSHVDNLYKALVLGLLQFELKTNVF